MGTKLKKLSGLVKEGGPTYNRFKMTIEEWRKVYKKRNQKGDINVIKFLEHFGELENIPEHFAELKAPEHFKELNAPEHSDNI